jgi:hypothetical protein
MNTGAILNRINFGLSLAAGQLPTAKLNNWALYDSLRTLSRSQQVDGVVKSMLGGQVSVETREVLMSGENPMLARGGAASDINGMAWCSTAARMMGGGRAGRQPIKDQGVKGLPRAQIPDSVVQ